MDPLQQQAPEAGKAVKLATPEQKKQLLDLIEATRGKLGEFNATSFAVDNQIEAGKSDALKQVFDALQSAGVDLTDPKSVSDFLQKLRIQNPHMSKLFEEALNQLLGEQGQEVPQMPPQEAGMGMMPPGGGSGAGGFQPPMM